MTDFTNDEKISKKIDNSIRALAADEAAAASNYAELRQAVAGLALGLVKDKTPRAEAAIAFSASQQLSDQYVQVLRRGAIDEIKGIALAESNATEVLESGISEKAITFFMQTRFNPEALVATLDEAFDRQLAAAKRKANQAR